MVTSGHSSREGPSAVNSVAIGGLACLAVKVAVGRAIISVALTVPPQVKSSGLITPASDASLSRWDQSWLPLPSRIRIHFLVPSEAKELKFFAIE